MGAGAVIVAAGRAERMGGIDKLFALVLNRPLLAWTISPFEESPSVEEVILVLREEQREQGYNLIQSQRWHKVKAIAVGGPRRQDSVWEGLKLLKARPWVIIHDGARPCLTQELITQGLEAARETGAAIAAVPLKDTVKEVDQEYLVRNTPPRETLWAAQTPQVFRYDIILAAYSQRSEAVTDDATLVERAGYPVKVYPGSSLNIKVAEPQDLAIAEFILGGRSWVPGQKDSGSKSG